MPALHFGVPCGQSPSTSQATQAPSGLQNPPDWDTQSALLKHCTQVEVAGLQSGPSFAAHCASEVQPSRHVKSVGLQMGLGVPQSPLAMHATHLPCAMRHRGVPPMQSLSLAHATHCCAGVWQTLVPPVQSTAERQPTHWPTPELASQMGVLFGQSPFVAQAAWQAWSPGQQAGEPTPQSEFVMQLPH